MAKTTRGVLAGITCVAALYAADVSAQSNDDPDVRWIEEHGFDSVLFMERCMSVDAWGREYVGNPLPVGGGWKMDCSSYNSTHWWVTQMQGSDGTLYCVLGELAELNVDGDSRLSIDITDDGEHGPAQLEATASEPVNITPVTAFGVANVWPLWLDAHYDTVDIVRDPRDGRACPQLFRVD